MPPTILETRPDLIRSFLTTLPFTAPIKKNAAAVKMTEETNASLEYAEDPTKYMATNSKSGISPTALKAIRVWLRSGLDIYTGEAEKEEWFVTQIPYERTVISGTDFFSIKRSNYWWKKGASHNVLASAR